MSRIVSALRTSPRAADSFRLAPNWPLRTKLIVFRAESAVQSRMVNRLFVPFAALAPSACRYGRRNFFRSTRFHHIKAPVTAEIPGTSPKSVQTDSVNELNLPK
jgi:hypothetical protein